MPNAKDVELGASEAPGAENILDTDKYQEHGAYHWTGTYPGARVWQFSPRSAAVYAVVLRSLSKLIGSGAQLGAQTVPLVLDLACGDGVMSYALEQHDAHVVGVDIENLALRYAREQHRKRKVDHLALVQASCGSLPFADNVFDACVAMELIEHVGTALADDLIREVRRVLRPGGFVFITTPQRQGAVLSSEYHVREFTAPELEVFLSSEFDNVEVFGYLSKRATRLYFAGGRLLRPLRLIWKVLAQLNLFNPFSTLSPHPTPAHEGLLASAIKRDTTMEARRAP